ncbi:MerR family transcriptional regulator [Thiocystis violacea]|uniref:MerR family transcriptional regulator n=1 Tax=Thiocystis violacea TaxID=13725 RepID=UPI0019080309|nr:MerR family transcriptional regulator [Thiocystis violacea]MBK1717632.1 MerR family transcriptional regulator [Thiocystis violacea]
MTATTWTIGQLARRFALARGTLLYYDSIGLLMPSGRTGGNYRLYGAADVERLAKIRRYRAAGLSLEAIQQLLRQEGEGPRGLLEQRLSAIDQEIQQLREQQSLILRLLKSDSATLASPMTKALWIAMLNAAGLDEAGMRRWHQAFERHAPEAHQAFLVSLDIDPEEIAGIRAWSNATDQVDIA